MRCYYMKDGHIAGVEMLFGLSDEDAIAESHRLFSEKAAEQYQGFELWDMARVILRHEKPNSPPPIDPTSSQES